MVENTSPVAVAAAAAVVVVVVVADVWKVRLSTTQVLMVWSDRCDCPES